MSITFSVRPHDISPGAQVCEIRADGKLVAVLYPREPNGVRLISAHLEGEEGVLQDFRFEL